MFKVTALPARFGDSLLIAYGDPQSPHFVLIDGGTAGTRKDIRREMEGQGQLELLVITHIDLDHISGVLELLEEGVPDFAVGDFWFNGWNHLPQNPDDEIFGAVQGERLTKRIVDLRLPWNKAFGGKAVVLSDDDSPLPRKTLPGGLQITLLSPTRQALFKLRSVWEEEVRQANLDPGFGLEPNDDQPEEEDEDEEFGAEDAPDIAALSVSAFKPDRSEANASSIAFLAEFEGKRVLFGADAHANVVLASLNRLSPDAPVRLDLFKISHHGSRGTTNRDLLRKITCSNYLISTNGSRFHHPDDEVIARILTDGGDAPTLIFNYRSADNEIWDSASLKAEHGYQTLYPPTADGGIEIEL